MVLRIVRAHLKVFVFVTLLLPFAASAQLFDSASPFTVSVSPEHPIAYGNVVLTPISNAFNLANATMVVLVNSKQVYQGNAQPVSVTLGASGALATIKVTVTHNGTPYSQTLSIRPQDVMLVVEPLSSAPPLYPGKPLVPLGGEVRVVAIAPLKSASGKAIPPTQLAYTWSVDGTKIVSASGIGRDALVVASPPQYRERKVFVSVQSQDGTVSGGGALSLVPEEPTVRIYQNDSLLGILYDHTLAGSYTLSTTETSLYGVPYSFPITNGAPRLEWFLNGARAQTGNAITLRPTGSGEGSASLSLVASVGELTKTIQLPIRFGIVTDKGGFFGL